MTQEMKRKTIMGRKSLDLYAVCCLVLLSCRASARLLVVANAFVGDAHFVRRSHRPLDDDKPSASRLQSRFMEKHRMYQVL